MHTRLFIGNGGVKLKKHTPIKPGKLFFTGLCSNSSLSS